MNITPICHREDAGGVEIVDGDGKVIQYILGLIDMKVNTCKKDKILDSCPLEGLNYQIDPYIGCEHHCYYCYALNEAETDWKNEIRIYEDYKKQLSTELSGLPPQKIYMGWNSDPYQPIEKEYGQTRETLEILLENGFSAGMLTKSDIVIRDIDLYTKMVNPSIGFSLAFQDESTRRIFEYNAPSNKGRIKVLKRVKKGGIRTDVVLCPVMPFITNVEEIINTVWEYADTIGIYGLSMDNEADPNWKNIKGILNEFFPEYTEKYREITFSQEHTYWKNLRKRLEEYKVEKNIEFDIHFG